MVPAPRVAVIRLAAALAVLLAAATAHAGGRRSGSTSSGATSGASSGATSGASSGATSGATSRVASKASRRIGRRSRIGRGGSKLGTVASSRGASRGGSSGVSSGGGTRRRVYGSDFVDSDEPLVTEASRGRPLGLGSQAFAGEEPATSSAATSSTATSSAHPSGARPSGRTSSRSSRGRRTAAQTPRYRSLVPRIEGRLPRLSTQEPGLLVVLSDVSSSMRHPFAGQSGVRKIDALADVVNGVLLDFVSRMNQGGTIKNRLDVLLAGYHSSSFSMFEGALAGRDIVSIAELADSPADEIEEDDGEGNMIPRPIWINPQVGRRTQMRGAFHHLRGAIAGWKRRPAGPHLVLGVHVTDGESTDGSPADQVEALAAEVQRGGGQLLMTNIHLSTSGSPDAGVLFPDEADAARLDAHGQMLFEMSSPVPAALAEQLGTKPGARMMAYNATVEQFARVFEAGSSIAAQ